MAAVVDNETFLDDAIGKSLPQTGGIFGGERLNSRSSSKLT
jgi:hypothetical protein